MGMREGELGVVPEVGIGLPDFRGGEELPAIAKVHTAFREQVTEWRNEGEGHLSAEEVREVRGSPLHGLSTQGKSSRIAGEMHAERKSGNGRKTACGVVIPAAGSGEAEPEAPQWRKGDIGMRREEETAEVDSGGGRTSRGIQVPPHSCVEVLSPSASDRDVLRRLGLDRGRQV